MRRVIEQRLPGAPHETLLVVDATTGPERAPAGAPVRRGGRRDGRRADEARRLREGRRRRRDRATSWVCRSSSSASARRSRTCGRSTRRTSPRALVDRTRTSPRRAPAMSAAAPPCTVTRWSRREVATRPAAASRLRATHGGRRGASALRRRRRAPARVRRGATRGEASASTGDSDGDASSGTVVERRGGDARSPSARVRPRRRARSASRSSRSGPERRARIVHSPRARATLASHPAPRALSGRRPSAGQSPCAAASTR